MERQKVDSSINNEYEETTGAHDLTLDDLPAPRIIEVNGNHVGRIPAHKQAVHISTLPYLHRNPAV
jgi:hypothetical protein